MDEQLKKIIEQEAEKRFWDKVDKRTDDKCWEWIAFRDHKGYGRISYQGKNNRAHRFSWELHNGLIPNDLWVLHKCDNPPCVNPNHLYLGTSDDNVRDRKERNRTFITHGSRNGRAILTPELVKEIRIRYINEDITQKQLSKEYNISRSQINEIVRFKSWIKYG